MGLRSFQRESNNDAAHDIVELVVPPRTKGVFIVTSYTGLGDGSICIDGFEERKTSSCDLMRIYLIGIIRHRL